jgi:hypothetical protein
VPSTQFEQWDFSVGEVQPDHVANPQFKLRSQSLRTARNVIPRIGGPVEARSGTLRLATAAGDGWLRSMSIGDETFFLLVTAGRFEVWRQADRSLVATVTGCPWNSGMMDDLVIEAYGSAAYLFHATMPPDVITRSSAGTWSRAPFAFDAGAAGKLLQPYFRFAAPSMTLTPNGTSGTVTLVTSAAYFSPAHVGLRLRLQEREVVVTAYSSATQVTATVTETLFPTMLVPVQSSAVFEIGEVIEGTDSKARGEITAKGAGTLTVLMQTMQPFLYETGTTPVTEKVVGPFGVTRTNGVPSNTTNAAVLDWDEQAISALRGYPSTGAIHRNRLWIANLPLIPFGIIASAIGAFGDMEVGTDDDDAIFELLGDAGAGRIEHIIAAEQMLVFTHRKVYYLPESETNPIRPTGFSVNEFGVDGASECRPCAISEGILFATTSGGAVMGAFPTGDVRRSWRTADLSYLANHLIRNPRSMAYIGGSPDHADRYAYASNGDGTMATVTYSETDADAVPGWALWESQGEFRSVAAADGECWALVRRVHGGQGTIYALEVFDTAAMLDAQCEPTSFHGQAAGSRPPTSTARPPLAARPARWSSTAPTGAKSSWRPTGSSDHRSKSISSRTSRSASTSSPSAFRGPRSTPRISGPDAVAAGSSAPMSATRAATWK